MPSKNVPSKIAKGEPEVTTPGALATIGFFTGVAAACFTVLSLTTFDLSDPGWSSSGSAGELINQGGVVGAYLADISYSLAGGLAGVIPLALLFWAYRRVKPLPTIEVTHSDRAIAIFGWLAFLGASAGLATMALPVSETLPQGSGGIVGTAIANWFTAAFSDLGARLLLSFCALLGGTLALDIDWIKVADKTGALTLAAAAYVRGKLDDLNDRRKLRKEKNKRSIQIAEHVEKEKRRAPPKIKSPKLLDSSSKRPKKRSNSICSNFPSLCPCHRSSCLTHRLIVVREAIPTPSWNHCHGCLNLSWLTLVLRQR